MLVASSTPDEGNAMTNEAEILAIEDEQDEDLDIIHADTVYWFSNVLL